MYICMLVCIEIFEIFVIPTQTTLSPPFSIHKYLIQLKCLKSQAFEPYNKNVCNILNKHPGLTNGLSYGFWKIYEKLFNLCI